MQERGRKNIAGKLVSIFNHGFDGEARASGKSEDELFQDVMERLRSSGLEYTEDDVLLALSRAERNHDHLLEGDRKEKANSAVSNFLDRFLKRDG